MVQPCWIPLAKQCLDGSGVKVCSAFGYPMGGDGIFTKVAAVRDCVAMGADELDVMPNVGWLKSGHTDRYRDEIVAVVDAAHGRPVKVMLEMGMLSEDEARQAAQLVVEAGATYVKNASGFGKGGQASVEAITQLKSWVDGRVRVKASGGVRTWDHAVALLDAGADLLGTSSGVAIVSGGGDQGDY